MSSGLVDDADSLKLKNLVLKVKIRS
jgi:hypothetical protein